MRPFQKYFASSLLAIGSIGGYTYYRSTSKSQPLAPTMDIYDETKLSKLTKDYIEHNKLQLPFFSSLYQKGTIFKSFLECTIVKNMNCLDYYNLYINENYQDVLVGKKQVSKDERQQMDKDAKLYCIFIPNKKLQDNIGTIHQGFITTLIDTMGAYLTFMVGDFVPPVTAYLNLTYHKPMEIEKEYISHVEIDKIEGRKIVVKAKVCDAKGEVYSSIESLYIQTEWDNIVVREALKIWSGLRRKQLFPDSYTGKNGHLHT